MYCGAEAVPSTLTCVACMRPGDLERYAAEYAVACILYYRHNVSFMEDHEFDGICQWMLQYKAWKKVPWLEKEMLRAGSGYDLARFPEKYHRLAEEHLRDGQRQ